MDGEYELFERRSDGTLSWRGLVNGLESAWVMVWLLCDETANECFAVDSTAGEVAIVRLPLRVSERIFQVGYDTEISHQARLLWQLGYDVTSVRGNRAAMVVLGMRPTYKLFTIDAWAPQPVRLEMIGWLHTHYPHAQVVDPAMESALHDLDTKSHAKPDAWPHLIAAEPKAAMTP